MKINGLIKKTLLISLILASNFSFAQLGINADNTAPSTNAMLDVKSTTKGVLIPRVGADLASPSEGLLYYNTTGHNFRYYDGTAWQNALFGNQWNINGTSISYSLGNVGIGTNAPVSPFDLFHPTNAIMYFHNNFSGTTASDGLLVGIDNSSTKVFFWNYENASIAFGTNGLERMTITSSGNVGIGYTGPTYKLSVNGDIYSNGLYSNGYTEIVGTLQANSTASFSSTVNVNGTLNANGNLAVDGNTTTNSGKGIVRSGSSSQMMIEEYSSPANITFSLAAGNTTCCIGIFYSAFTVNPTIVLGETVGAVANPGFIVYTVDAYTSLGSANIRVTNIGTGTASATNAVVRGMIIGRK